MKISAGYELAIIESFIQLKIKFRLSISAKSGIEKTFIDNVKAYLLFLIAFLLFPRKPFFHPFSLQQ
jgi:hypothetical protein